MSKTFVSANRFFREFLQPKEGDVVQFWREEPPYALILGAGASRSAGIPLAGEMETMLARFGVWAQQKIPTKPKSATTLSWYFERLLPALPWDDEYSDVKYRYEFIRKCIGRAKAEPNLTHLLAAHFTVSGLFGPIITTNFDDQTLAAFWHLPMNNAYTEPHVIYDPRSTASSRIIPEVPIIIKAHGHHTIWGTGVLDREIKELAPHVEQLLDEAFRYRTDSFQGFLVVGYSGFWNDGVVRFLKRRWNVPIYWCYCGGKKPSNENIEQIAQRNNVRFVRIKDSDALFISLWQEIHSEEEFYRPRLLSNYQLFNVQRQFPRGSSTREMWWESGPVAVGSDEESCRNHPKLVSLREKLCPVLKELEEQDQETMFYDCLLKVFHPKVPQEKKPLLRGEELPGTKKLRRLLPVNFDWTRRNRKLFQLALGRDIDWYLPFEILSGAAEWD